MFSRVRRTSVIQLKFCPFWVDTAVFGPTTEGTSHATDLSYDPKTPPKTSWRQSSTFEAKHMKRQTLSTGSYFVHDIFIVLSSILLLNLLKPHLPDPCSGEPPTVWQKLVDLHSGYFPVSENRSVEVPPLVRGVNLDHPSPSTSLWLNPFILFLKDHTSWKVSLR